MASQFRKFGGAWQHGGGWPRRKWGVAERGPRRQYRRSPGHGTHHEVIDSLIDADLLDCGRGRAGCRPIPLRRQRHRGARRGPFAASSRGRSRRGARQWRHRPDGRSGASHRIALAGRKICSTLHNSRRPAATRTLYAQRLREWCHDSCGSRAANVRTSATGNVTRQANTRGASLGGAEKPRGLHRRPPRRRHSCAAVSAANTRTQAAGT